MSGRDRIRTAVFISLASIILVSIGLTLNILWSTPSRPPTVVPEKTGQRFQDQTTNAQEIGQKVINLLIMGVDRRGSETGRTDTIMLYRVDLQKKKIGLLSIPRDTLLEIPGRGWNKVNHAYAYGGIQLSKEALEGFLEIKIDYYVETDFKGFINLVDQLGGITVNVEKDITEFGLKKGMQKLNGKQALTYVRDRNDPTADLARVHRQQRFMKALVKEVKDYTPKYKLLKQVPQLYGTVKTDLSLKEAYSFYEIFGELEFMEDCTAVIPGTPFNYKGQSYWKPDTKKTEEIVNRIFT